MSHRLQMYLAGILVVCLGFVALPTPALAQSYLTVAVQPGDSLGKIAGRYCTNWQTVYDINRQTIGPNPSAIEVGMILTVPNGCGGSVPTQLPSIGGSGVYDRGPTTHASGVFNSPYYTVAWGDTIYSVANRFGLSQDALLRANNIYQGGLLTGQTLLIPGLGSGGQQPQPPRPQPPVVNAERVYFGSGNIAASLVGTIVNGGAKRYILGGRAGQVMEIGTRSHGEPLTVTVEPIYGGSLRVNGPNSGLENNLWVDLPSSGDYIVTINPVRLPEGPQLNFDVTFVIQ